MIDTAFIKSNNKLIKQMMRIPALKDVDGEDLNYLVNAGRIGKYHSGEIIFEEGSESRFIFYLISGKVKISKGGHYLLTLHRTGDVFGEIGPITGKARSATVEAISEVSCVEIDLSAIDKRSQNDSHMFRYLIFRGFAEVLASRLQDTNEQMLAYMDELSHLKKKP